MPNKTSSWDRALADWMAAVDCLSWAELQRRSSLSRYRIRQLRDFQLSAWPLQDLQALSNALDISLVEVLAAAGQLGSSERSSPMAADDARDLSDGARDSSDDVQASFRLSTLQVLEPLLRQLPTAAYAVEHHNLPANQLLKVLHPVNTLLVNWGVEAMGTVGSVVAYDPSWQQPLTDETYKRDTPVSIRYVGYRVGNRIWLKAQVRATR